MTQTERATTTQRDLIVLGEALVSLIPENRESVRRSRHLRRFTGGTEVNVAVAASRLGHKVTWIGRLGDDLPGQAILDDLCQEGVLLDQVVIDGSRPTGLLVREAVPLSPARVSYARAHSAGSRVSKEDINLEVVSNHRMAHVSGVTPALSPEACDAAAYFLTIARENGLTTVFDLNYRSQLWSREDAAAAFVELASLADIVSGGSNEWNLTYGTDDLTQVSLPSLTTLIKTTGKDGVEARVAGEILRAETFDTTVVDVVGAGDGFVGGVLSAVLAGARWPDALRQGTFCGARVVSGIGDWSNLPWGTRGLVDIPDNDQEVLR
jgi:2-dehydro-3-deoxygluconokinase